MRENNAHNSKNGEVVVLARLRRDRKSRAAGSLPLPRGGMGGSMVGMISLIHRHVLWEVAKASAAAVSLFAFILIAGNAIKEILAFLLDGRMNFWFFLQLLGLLIPYVVSYALPMGVLMGILSVFGRMCAAGEYTAYRACGVSLGYISRPIIVFALLCAGMMLAINFYFAPTARGSYYSSLAQTIRADPLRFVLPKTFVKEFPGYVLYARERKEGVLKDFWIWELDNHNRPVKLIRAQEGKLAYNHEDDTLTLELKNGFSELRDPKNPDDLKQVRPTLSFDHAKLRLGLSAIIKGERKGKIETLTLDGLRKLEEGIVAKIKQTPGDRGLKEQLSLVRYQVQQNFAFSGAVVALTLVGIPLAIRVSRRENTANLAVALGLGMAYYLLFVITSWAGRHPELHPEWLVWAPNLIFVVIGASLLRRAAKS
jgi:lipopolysaccharide export system permease protein